jgi:hypothetical protein
MTNFCSILLSLRARKVDYIQFLAEMQFNGLRKSVAEEYLEVMKDLDLIKFENEDIIWIGDK